MPSACAGSLRWRTDVPVRKFRTLEAAETKNWCDPLSPSLWPTLSGLWRLSSMLHRSHFPPGVYRHRSIEEANRQCDEWEARMLRPRS